MSPIFSNGSIKLPANLEKTEELLKDMLNFIYAYIPLDYEKISGRVGYDDLDPDHSGDWNFMNNFSSGSTDCKYSYVINSTRQERLPCFPPDVLPCCTSDDRQRLNSPNCDLITRLHAYVQAHGARSVKLKGIRSLTINNYHGVNKDNRGTRGLDWVLKYHRTFSIIRSSSITLHDLIIACYKTKSHKFETWYEFVDGPKDVTIRDGALVFDLDVSHGS